MVFRHRDYSVYLTSCRNRSVAVSLGPQRQLPQPSVRQLPSAFFGTGFAPRIRVMY